MGTQFVELGSQHYRQVKGDSRGKWFQRLAKKVTISRGRCHDQDVDVSPIRPASEDRTEHISSEAARDIKLPIEYRADVF